MFVIFGRRKYRMYSLKPKCRKFFLNSLVIGILLVSVFMVAFPVKAQPSVLELKWEATGTPGGGEGMLIADVRGDYIGEEIIYAGEGEVVCLDGRYGNEIWGQSYSGVSDTVQIQMGDVDNDGDLEIIVPMKHPAGLWVLHADTGDDMWSIGPNWGWGRVDCSPVIADIDGDGYPTIFFATMGFLEQPNTGKLIAFEYDPSEGTIVERYRRIIWHPCSGGLSIADTDNDGIFELYMGDRHVYYNDGSWARGCRSFWAENFSSRWDLYDWLMSSNIPMLADVDKDGILDVIATQLRGGLAVLNSSDGRPLGNRLNYDLDLPGHYQPTIYDIDGDGNLEILLADGEHDSTTDDIVIWDLYNWEEDARMYVGKCWQGPQVGNVYGDEDMEIIATSFYGVHVFDNSYNLLYEITGLGAGGRLVYAVIQDIDDDGHNEIVVPSQGRRIYAFDIDDGGFAPIQRARSEVQFYSERRLGVSEYVPFERPWPDVSSPSPANGQKGVDILLSELSFNISHPEGASMSYTVTTDPDIGSDGNGPVGNGRYSVSVGGLVSSTTYTWHAKVTDDEHWTNKTFTFTTGPYTPNSSPEHDIPNLNSTSGNNIFRDDFTCFNQSTTDLNDDEVTNIYNWYKNDEPITNLLLPFDTKTSVDDEYSGYAVTKDYSGYDNDGTVFGASWTNDGVVGGAYTFGTDGVGNDFIRIEENGDSLGGDGSWSEISIEFWVKATTNTGTERLIWKHDRYDKSTIGYRIDFRARSNRNELTWRVYTPSQYALTYYILEGPRDWHHVVCTYKSGMGLKMYVDGVEVASGLCSGNIQATADGPLDIAFNSGSDFRGVLDEVRIYPNAISPFQISNRYVETKDGLSNNSTIIWQEKTEGDAWKCQVTPNDGFGDGEPKFSSSLLVPEPVNTQPMADNLTITPLLPSTTDDLIATYDYFDADDDPEYGTEILWYKDGELQPDLTYSSIVPSSLTAKDQEWNFTVRPKDAIEFGDLQTSSSVTILNTPPSFTGVYITPDPAFNTSTLTADPYGWSDVDDDAEYYFYQWEKLGTEGWQDIADETSETLTPDHFDRGDYIRINCTAFDGEHNGTSHLRIAWIVDSDPPEHSEPLLISSPDGDEGSDEELICYNQNTTDPEGDRVTNVYHWLKNGESITTLLTPFEINSSVTAKDYSGNGNDGSVFGAVWTSQGVAGGAYTFDGDDVIIIPDDESLGGFDDWSEISLEYWIKPSEPRRGTRIIARKTGPESTGSYMTGFQTSGDPPNTLFWGITINGDWVDISEDPNWDPENDGLVLDVGKWYHIFCTYQSGPGLTVYINGIEKFKMPLTGAIDYDDGEELFIGSSGEDDERRWVYGDLDEIRMYRQALTPAQIFQRYMETKAGLTNHSTIVPQETTVDDVWTCEVIPCDSWQDGTPRTSDAITVKSAVPGRPRIDIFTPSNTTPEVNEGDSLNFTQISSDPDGDTITYSWILDDVEQATGQNWTYSPGFEDVGVHNVTLVISDGELTDSQQWTVTVLPMYELTIQVAGNGTTSPVPDVYVYDEGTDVSVDAIPDGGWMLDYWLLDDVDVGNETSYIVTMDFDHNLTAVFVEVPPIQFDDAYLVVRGMNNRIYYRIYNSSSSSWESWNVVPNGATCDSPAAVVCSGKLYIVVRGMDEQSLWFGWINLTDNSFSDWTRLTGATPSVPTLVRNDSQLILVVRGLNNRIYYRFYNCTSDEWEERIVVPTGVTCDSPAATILANELHIVVRGISATNSSMWHGHLNLTTGTFSGWTRLSGATPSAPTLATSQTSNKLYLTVRGLNNFTYYNTWNGTGWEGWTVLPSGATCDGPAATIIGDELRIVVRGMDGHSLWHYHINLSTSDHSGWTRISGATPSTPTLIS